MLLASFLIVVISIYQILKEVSHLGLSIYGIGWDRDRRAAELLPFWRGVLPLEDIATLYSNSKVL